MFGFSPLRMMCAFRAHLPCKGENDKPLTDWKSHSMQFDTCPSNRSRNFIVRIMQIYFYCCGYACAYLLSFIRFHLMAPLKPSRSFRCFFFFSLLYFKIEIVINSRGNSLALQIGFLGFLVVVAEQIGLAASIDVDIRPRYACIVVGGARERTIMITIIVITCVMCDPIWVPMRPLLLLHSPASRLGAILISFSRMNMNMSFGWILHIFFLFVIRKKIADSHFPR